MLTTRSHQKLAFILFNVPKTYLFSVQSINLDVFETTRKFPINLIGATTLVASQELDV